MINNLRRASQAIFLLLFLFLFIQTESKGYDDLGYPVRLFLDFDPLIFITTLLASHTVPVAFYLSIILIVLTVFMGRVFCGWVCPLGTLNNMTGALRKARPVGDRSRLYRWKYFILLFILSAALFRLHLTGIFDPLSLLIRSLSVSLYPLFNYAVRSFFDAIFHWNPPMIVHGSEFLYDLLKSSVLAFEQPLFVQSAFIGLLFLIVLGLNLTERRFWCKFLCPLGALLGILSRYALLRRSLSEGCDACGACETLCQGGAIHDGDRWELSECLYCMNCDDLCPRNAVSFGFSTQGKPAALDLGRRNVVIALASGIVSVPLIRTTALSKPGYMNPRLIRPPGALEEREFLRACIKCGECMKVCITNGLQPTLLEAGVEGIWSPVLIPRIGYCEYRCTLCGQVCPTGAIARLKLEQKQKVRIGLAMIDEGRCLPYAHATPCIVCQEACPTSPKAIWLEETRVRNRQGKIIRVKRPHVDLELCIGCGICETLCPVIGQPAIYVTNVGESRSKTNQLLLPGAAT
jgi:polyferredoxin